VSLAIKLNKIYTHFGLRLLFFS